MRKYLMLLFALVLALGLAWSQLALADETAPPAEDEVTETEPPADTVENPADYTAALEAAKTTLDGMQLAEKVKARLMRMFETRLREAAARGLTADQLMSLSTEMTRLCGEVNLQGDLSHLNACCQLMVKAMRSGFTAEDVGAMISAKLAAGLDLKTALKQTRYELKGKTPREKQEKDRPAKEEKGKPEGQGQGKNK